MQSQAQMNPAALASAVLRFRKVRRDVWSDGTRRPTSTQEEHLGNQQKLRTTLTTLSERASLSNWSGGGEAVAHRLWREMWTKIRYAGFRAYLATREIESLSTEPGSFDQYRMFADSRWNIAGPKRHRGWDNVALGDLARDFMTKSGVYAGRFAVANSDKLKHTVALARA